MPPLDAVVGQRWSFVDFLRTELAPRPGRVATVVRITVCCTLIAIIWMIFQIPMPAYPVYVVFLLSRGEASGTLLVASGGIIAATLAVAISLLFYTLDAGEPALRIPLMALSTFLGMYLTRAIVVGQVAFLAGFVLVITQILIDDAPNPEALTRIVLWLWVIVVAPAVLTAAIDLVATQRPADLVRGSIARLFGTAAARLRTPKSIIDVQPTAAEVAELRERISMLDSKLAARTATDVEVIASVDELMRIASVLPADVPAAVRGALAARCDACRDAVTSGMTPRDVEPIPRAIVDGLDANVRPVVVAIGNVLDRVNDVLRRPQRPDPPQARRATSLFVPDAFTNPEHVRFALKATLATMATYIIYRGLDWPGIRTCVITCFFVALGTTGETVHKLMLRITGAVVGGLLGALCIVYVMPHMTDIGDLCVLVALVTVLCAWIATSSELLSYAGMQMALAFYIGVLQGYGPGTELAELRDRVAGILLGNVAMSIVFSTVWPVSARTAAHRTLGQGMRALAGLLRAPSGSPTPRLAISRSLNQARQLLATSAFEVALMPQSRRGHARRDEEALGDVERIAAAVFVVTDQTPQPTQPTPETESAATWLDGYAAHLRDGAPKPLPLSDVGGTSTTGSSQSGQTVADRSVAEAQALLRSSINRATAHAQ